MEPMLINTSLYSKLVGTSSVSIALTEGDLSRVNPAATGFNATFSNTGASWAYVEAGIGSAPTVIYPLDDTKKTGKLLPPGVVTWKLPDGTTHLSLIAVSGSNLIGVAIGQGG